MSSLFKSHTGVYVIAEIGINHNGDLNEAKTLIRAAVDSGAHAVKFQVRHLESIYTKAVLDDPLKAEQSTQYLMSELKKAHFTFEQIEELQKYSKQFQVDFFATPFDLTSADFLQSIHVELYKIGSPDFTNLPLINRVASFNKPIILSTGMSDESEIIQVIDFLKSKDADFSLLHCNSTYPAAVNTINLNYMKVLKQISEVSVGYSGHEEGFAPTLAAVALGAEIIERHITMNREHSGPDHRSSLLPQDFKAMVKSIQEISQALGKPRRVFGQGERSNRLSLAKSLVASRDLKAGAVLTERDLDAKTPAKGLSPLELNSLIGKVISHDLKKDDYFFPDDLEDTRDTRVAPYQINRQWGIVGRLNDFRDYLDLKPHLVEIHMTWRDIAEYARPKEVFAQDLVVHAPEYFKDQLIDFTSTDPKITELSVEMLQKVINIARDLAPQFKGHTDSRGPRVVVHPGGHFASATQSNKTEQYRILKKNLKAIQSEGVRLLVENMPPRPWYFGGQWFNTVFMDAGEIAQFAQDMKWEVCFDTSHAQLYCNFAGTNLKEFTNKILNHTAYLHISDAKGFTEEGLQIGQGDINFEQFFGLIKNFDKGFIPEIWQGHLNRGRGFKDALEKIETLLHKVSGESCST